MSGCEAQVITHVLYVLVLGIALCLHICHILLPYGLSCVCCAVVCLCVYRYIYINENRKYTCILLRVDGGGGIISFTVKGKGQSESCMDHATQA